MWHVLKADNKNWVIEDLQTKKRKTIGKVGGKRVNYYDRAVDEAIEKNLSDYGEAVTVTADGSKYDMEGEYVGMLELPSD